MRNLKLPKVSGNTVLENYFYTAEALSWTKLHALFQRKKKALWLLVPASGASPLQLRVIFPFCCSFLVTRNLGILFSRDLNP
jgi:hypothetical protein